MDTTTLQGQLANSVVLAPLTRVGNLPFRRLCREYGADITYSEMIYARLLVRGEGRERALLRKHQSESCFGAQLAALQLEEGVEAAQIARERGADFIDINCGCPIDETTRRGLGAALLRRSRTLVKLVEGLVKNLDCAVTAKLRLGWNQSSINVIEVARELEGVGAAAITVHGRTREQRYTAAADWELIGKVREAVSIPVIGNGDILTPFEARHRLAVSGVRSLMLARGALIKPWLFSEIKDGAVLNLTVQERVAIYFRLSRYLLEHFGDDELGRKRSLAFLAYQFDFLHRFKYLPEDAFAAPALEYPLIQSRLDPEGAEGGDRLTRLLACPDPEVHKLIAEQLLAAGSAEEAENALTTLAESRHFEVGSAERDEISNG